MTTDGRCESCGLDVGSISPLDGIVALRSFPRRYQAALAGADDDEAGEEVLRRRPAPQQWSPLEHVAHVVDVLAASRSWARELRSRPRPALAAPHDRHLATISDGGGSVALALDHLRSAAATLADELEQVAGDEWDRAGELPWGDGDLLDVMRNAVHQASHHLREATKALSQVEGR